jgi:hypothetical protein
MMIRDLIKVEQDLGFSYEMERGGEHYQQICPRCRRALLGLAQGSAWSDQLTGRAPASER